MYVGFGMPANRMQKNATMAIEHPCKIYDVFETDYSKKLIRDCPNINDACDFLGVKSGTIHQIIKNKSRHRNQKLGRVITIR